MNKAIKIILSISVGFINALFGAGGGLVAVSLFKSEKLSQKESQATAISVILPLTIISAVIYMYKGYFHITDALGYIPFGIIGSLIGPILVKKIPDKVLRKIFALFMIYSGINMIMR
jgi:uncharacterized membrane protein YfcA